MIYNFKNYNKKFVYIFVVILLFLIEILLRNFNLEYFIKNFDLFILIYHIFKLI